MITLRSRERHFLRASVCGLALLLAATSPAAADENGADPVADGTGGPTTLTPPAANAASSVTQGITAAAQLTVDTSTGFAIGSLAFQLPKARGDAQPTLALTYSSANSTVVGFAGLGWTLPTPSITRRGAAGMPRFSDDVFTTSPSALADMNAAFDDYVVDGRALVPICVVNLCAQPQLAPNETLPAALLGTSLADWMYFRSEIDDRARYFFDPTGQTWIKQEQSGLVTQFGHPLDSGAVDASLSDAIERPAATTHTFSGLPAVTAAYRWNIVRQSDAVGNTVYYAWTNMGAIAPNVTSPGTLYLSDVYDTLAVGQSPVPAAFAHHTHLTWQLGPSSGPLYTPIWRAAPMAQLAAVDVTSASWLSTKRGLVRRYGLTYTPNRQGTRNRLTSVTLEGQCETATNDPTPVQEVNNVVPTPSGCPSASVLTLASYSYSRDAAPTDWVIDAAWTSLSDLATFNPRISMVDVNGDGASDLVYPTLGSGFTALPLSTAAQVLADPTGQATLVYTTQNNALANTSLVFGDWLSDGLVDWMADGSILSPRGWTFQSYPRNSSWACQRGNATDMDGDGLTDCAQELNTGTSAGVVVSVGMSQQGRGGGILPFAMTPTPMFTNNLDWTTVMQTVYPAGSSLMRSMGDVDGDGIVDAIAIVDQFGVAYIYVWPGHGDSGYGVLSGDYGTGNLDSAEMFPNYYGLYNSLSSPNQTDAFQNALVTFADLDHDGLAELVKLTSTQLFVCAFPYNNCPYINLPALTPAGCGLIGSAGPFLDPSHSFLSASDIDGTGVPRIVFNRSILPTGVNGSVSPGCRDTSVYEMKVGPGSSASLGAAPSSYIPGLLLGQTLLGGEQQTLTYQPLRTLNGVSPIPTVAWVATSLQSSNGLPATSKFARATAKSYAYSNPVYDPRDKQFVGFQSTTESQSGDSGAPGLVRSTNFATSACSVTGATCTGQQDYGWFRALRGLPVATSDADTTGANIATTTIKYTEMVLYTGLDGRLVRRVPVAERSVYQWTPGAIGTALQVFPFLGLTMGGYETYTAANGSVTVAVPQSTPTKRTTATESVLGDQRVAIDFGQPGVDTPIRTEQLLGLPPGDVTGWSYRLVSSNMGYTTDASGAVLATPPARSYTYQYTSAGQLMTQLASLSNEPAPMSAAGGFAADTPPDASTGPSVCVTGCTSGSVTGIQYDGFGNAVVVPGPNNRCSAVTYDPLFAQLPQTNTRYQAGCASSDPPPFVSGASYDRALEVVVQTTSPVSGNVAPLVTMTKYDPFGRMTEVDAPSDQMAGVADTQNPSVLTQYSDSGPVRLVTSKTVDGTDASPVYRSHASAIDGFGDSLYRLDQTDAINTPWIVSGAQTRYGNGLRKGGTQPFYTSGSTLYSSVETSMATVPNDLSQYDGAGRLVAHADFKKQTTTYAYAFNTPGGAQCTTVLDPEQQPGGAHAGASSTQCVDGQGRQVSATQVLQNPARVTTTTTTYTAAGERTSITQGSTDGGSYQRQMAYDTLGRMVTQVEPDSVLPHQSFGGSHGYTGTWQYVYNDSGQLVGLSDARGCGKVIYHDALGRVVAEDYSPCRSATAVPYSAPDLSTGDGTESFYSYDSYGNVAVESDRAQTSSYIYDSRNRLSSLGRQVAVPGGSDTLALRYAPRLYIKSVTGYTLGNRPLGADTGADAQDLLFGGSSQVYISYGVTGAISSVSSSYGPLVTRQAFDAAGRLLIRDLADAAGTETTMGYDPNGAVSDYGVSRAAGPWTTYGQGSPPTASDYTTQSELVGLRFTYDKAGNPTSIRQPDFDLHGCDGGGDTCNLAAEWPAGSLPATTRTMAYGDDYRLTSVNVSYASAGGDDIASASGNPYTNAEVQAATYPPLSPTSTGSRVRSQSYAYDFRGNVKSSHDDAAIANSSWDRSFGTATYLPGTDVLSTVDSGNLYYDYSGNIIQVATATGEQYDFGYDELGRLASATRFDSTGSVVAESYTYDASGERVMTDTAPASGTTGESLPDVYTINVFDTLVLKNASYPDATGDYEDDDSTEQIYLKAGGETFGQVVYAASLPSTKGNVHVFMPMADPLGSTSVVIDRGTGELVEAASYQAYGGVDSDYRPARWNSFRDDQRFTGQWDNAEMGLVYMHARYYLPALGRFISPDPRSIHGGLGDNPYAYANGSPFRYSDPTGLAPTGGCDILGCWAQDTDQTYQDPNTGVLNVAELISSAPVPPPPPAQEDTQLIPTYADSLFGPSPGNMNLRPILTPNQIETDKYLALGSLTMLNVGLLQPSAYAENAFVRGGQFEQQGLEIIGGTKNTTTYSGATTAGNIVDTIPDNTESAMFGNAWNEFKDVQNLSFTRQLQAQQNAALSRQVPWNVIVSPNNVTVTQPLWDAVTGTGGNIYVLDPNPTTIEGD